MEQSPADQRLLINFKLKPAGKIKSRLRNMKTMGTHRGISMLHKVIHKIKAHHAGGSPCYVGIPAEITVDLKSKKHHRR